MPDHENRPHTQHAGRPRALRLGVAGPVGTGKSSILAALCRALAPELSMAVVTNDIYTDEDARFLRSAGVLPTERIRAVETGACPHTAIRDDVTANLDAVEDLEEAYGPLDLVLVESGGDNLTATFSPALADAQLFCIDVAGGGDVARKGGPGITGADLLIVNKTDLAPHVEVDVAAMVADAEAAEFGDDHAEGHRLFRNFHLEQLLDRQSQAQVHVHPGEVIHAVGVRNPLPRRKIFADLFRAAM